MEKLPHRVSGLPIFVLSVVVGMGFLATAAWLLRVQCTYCDGSGRWVVREPEVIQFEGCAKRCPQHPPFEWKIPGQSMACEVCRSDGKISLLQKAWYRQWPVTVVIRTDAVPVVPAEN